RGLLLRHAVDGAQAPDKVATMDPHNLAAGKETSNDVECDPIIRIVEGRDQDKIVGDIKVAIAGGQPLSPEDDRAGKRQFDDFQLASLKISSSAQAAQVFLKRFIVSVAALGFNGGKHR